MTWQKDPGRYKARGATFAAIMRLKQSRQGKGWDAKAVKELHALLDQYESLGGIVQRSEEETRFALNSPSLWIPQEEVQCARRL